MALFPLTVVFNNPLIYIKNLSVVGVAPCGYPLIWASTGACPYNKTTILWNTAITIELSTPTLTENKPYKAIYKTVILKGKNNEQSLH